MAKLLESSAFGLLSFAGVLALACSSGDADPEATATPTDTTATTTAATSGGSTSTTGASTTGGSASAGVLIEGECRPLCMDDSTDADANGVTDGWGFEMGTSCVVPGGAADNGETCDDPKYNEPPADPSTPGSGVLINDDCTRVCNDDSTDDDGSGTDGWGWEYNASCVVPGGVVDPGADQACTDFEMPMASEPGGTVDVDGTCYAVCLDDSTDDDGMGNLDGWGYDEAAMESCIVPGGMADTGMPCAS